LLHNHSLSCFKLLTIFLITLLLVDIISLTYAKGQLTNSSGPNSAAKSKTGTGFFDIVFKGSRSFTGKDSERISTDGQYKVSFVNITENGDTEGKVDGMGHISIEANTEDGCFYKFKGSYTISGTSIYRNFIDETHPKGSIQPGFLRSDPGEAIYAPLKSGPKSCFSTYHFGYTPLLICGEQTPAIDLVRRTAAVEFHRQGENEVCEFTAAGGISSNTPPKEDCNNINEEVKSYSAGPWKLKYQIVKGQGLVLREINAGDQHQFDSISTPHFKIQYANGQSKIIRFCDPDDPNPATTFAPSPTIKSDNTKGIDTLQWNFVKEFNEDEINGRLSITYDLVIRWKAVNNCELSKNECYRFIPKVSYNWIDNSGSQPTLERFAAFYKLDYGLGTALARVHDADLSVLVPVESFGRQPMITNEIGFVALSNGQPEKYDNIHSAHPGEDIFIPGCRHSKFDCTHLHWRWSEIKAIGNIDPMVEPSDDKPIDASLRGKPYLVPGQTIAIAIVKHNAGEEDPDDPSTLLNNEQIATATGLKIPTPRGGTLPEDCPNCHLVSADHPILWYVASIPNKSTDTFFRHGIFVLNTAK
jgi:hypothetical protein